MRLTMTMFFGKKPYGYLYRGKYRKLKPITNTQLFKLREDYERTEQNMLILRHPYLTVEQSEGHMDINRGGRYLKLRENVVKLTVAKFSKHVTIAENLAHLKVKDAWD